MKELDRSGRSSTLHTDTFDFTATCINLGRINWGSEDQTTFQRMVEGWLAVHSFVAREGLEERKMADALGGTGIGAPATPSINAPEMERLVGTLESGLSFVVALAGSRQRLPVGQSNDIALGRVGLSRFEARQGLLQRLRLQSLLLGWARVGVRQMGASPHVCRLPLLSAAPQHQQKLGVPFFTLQAATSYLKLLAEYLTQVAAQTFGAPADNSPSSARQTALAHYSAGMRPALFLEQWANALNQAAGVDTQAGTCPGNPADCAVIAKQFNAAARELETFRAVAMGAAQALHDARNPFNIPENDVPLFFGDPSGVNSQYFASSDYLLHGWALPAITVSLSPTWTRRGGRGFCSPSPRSRTSCNLHNRKQEVDQLMSKYGSPILANCGNLQVADGKGGVKLLDDTQVIPYFADGTRTLSNDGCYIDQSCGGGAESVDENLFIQTMINGNFLGSTGLLPGSVSSTNGRRRVRELRGLHRSPICSNSCPRNTFVNLIANVCPGEKANNASAPNARYSSFRRTRTSICSTEIVTFPSRRCTYRSAAPTSARAIFTRRQRTGPGRSVTSMRSRTFET